MSVIIFLYSLPHRSISAALAICIPLRLIFFLYQILNFLTKNCVFLTFLVESWKPISLLVFYLTLKTDSLFSQPFPLHHEFFFSTAGKDKHQQCFCWKSFGSLVYSLIISTNYVCLWVVFQTLSKCRLFENSVEMGWC